MDRTSIFARTVNKTRWLPTRPAPTATQCFSQTMTFRIRPNVFVDRLMAYLKPAIGFTQMVADLLRRPVAEKKAVHQATSTTVEQLPNYGSITLALSSSSVRFFPTIHSIGTTIALQLTSYRAWIAPKLFCNPVLFFARFKLSSWLSPAKHCFGS